MKKHGEKLKSTCKCRMEIRQAGHLGGIQHCVHMQLSATMLGLMSLHKVSADVFCVCVLLASRHKHKPSKLRGTQPSCAGRRGPILIVRAVAILRKACNQIQAIKLELHPTGGLMQRAFNACNPYTRSAAGPRLQRDHNKKSFYAKLTAAYS